MFINPIAMRAGMTVLGVLVFGVGIAFMARPRPFDPRAWAEADAHGRGKFVNALTHTIKAGMTTNDVLALAGQPDAVVTDGTGMNGYHTRGSRAYEYWVGDGYQYSPRWDSCYFYVFFSDGNLVDSTDVNGF
jgi:hypothetical protein